MQAGNFSFDKNDTDNTKERLIVPQKKYQAATAVVAKTPQQVILLLSKIER